jgi:hypothetical protein
MDKGKKRIEVTVKNLLFQDQDTVIKTVLENIMWPVKVNASTSYFIRGDDSDGVRSGVEVSFLRNGDGIIDFRSSNAEGGFSDPHVHRIRTQLGGGHNNKVHAALLVLALAIMDESDEEISKD